jgi:ketosteroid isomerase-like protein
VPSRTNHPDVLRIRAPTSAFPTKGFMKHWYVRSAFASLMIIAAAPAFSQGQTIYDPSPTDARIVAVIDAQKRFEAASMRGDWDAVEAFFAPDLLVHAPINRVVNRDNVMARMRGGQIAYEPGGEHRVEFIGVRGDVVVVMGEESVKPTANAPNVGKLVRRRFTDIWKIINGTWKLTIRHSTVTSVE